MTTLTVNIDNKKSEKAVKVLLDALGLSYSIDANTTQRPLNKAEKKLYNNLKNSFKEIRLHQEGKIQLPTIEEVLAKL